MSLLRHAFFLFIVVGPERKETIQTRTKTSENKKSESICFNGRMVWKLHVFGLCKHLSVSTGRKKKKKEDLVWSENSHVMQFPCTGTEVGLGLQHVVRLAVARRQTQFRASRFLSHFSTNYSRSLQLNNSQTMEFASWSEFCNSSLPVVMQSDSKANKPRATPSHWLWSRNSYYPAIYITKHPVW